MSVEFAENKPGGVLFGSSLEVEQLVNNKIDGIKSKINGVLDFS